MPPIGIVSPPFSTFVAETDKTGRGRAGFFWAGSALMCTLWAYFRLPETKDRSPAQLDKLFMQKVPARKFKQTVVDVFDEDTQAAVKTV
jgi:SP family general alpha glucoside:H+ symporter-like MFS transporter